MQFTCVYWLFAGRLGLFATIACIIIFSLLGCTATQIEHQALSHNQAFTNSADKILLGNIVRSSRYLPVDYTAITDYTAEGTVSGSIQGKFPFGADASRLFSLDPSVSVSPGIASLEIKDYAHQKESFFKLYEDIEIQNFSNLVDSGWDQQLVLTILVQAYKIRGTFGIEFIRRSDLKCLTEGDKYRNICSIIKISNECKDTAKENLSYITRRIDSPPVRLSKTFVNSGDNLCEFLAFQAVSARAYVLGIGFDVVATSKVSTIFHENPTDKQYYGKGKLAKSLEELHKDVNEELSASNRAAFETVGRSTHLMLRYLGQLARAQLHLPEAERWTPEIMLDPSRSTKPTKLFLLREGTASNEKAAVMVEFDGRNYYIPEATYQESDHKSLQLFTFLRIRLDQAYAQTKLPPSNTLVLR